MDNLERLSNATGSDWQGVKLRDEARDPVTCSTYFKKSAHLCFSLEMIFKQRKVIMLTADQLSLLYSRLEPLSPPSMATDPASSPLQFQSLTEVRLSDKERIDQNITSEHAATAITALHRDGIVCLSNAVDPIHVQKLHGIMEAEVATVRDLPTTYWNNNTADGRHTGNMGQGPPLEPALMFSDVWANGPTLAVISSVLGPNPRVNFVGGNTLLANFKGVRQNVHPDLTFNHGMIPFAYCVNIFLSDTTVENGSTELWLGSHRDCSYADQQPKIQQPGQPASRFAIKPELVEERRRFAPPFQPSIPKGSVVIRDMRLWHAGRTNQSPNPRIMLAFVHTAWWYECPGEVVMPQSAKRLVDQWAKGKYPVMYNPKYVAEGKDPKAEPFTVDFDSENLAFKALLPKLPKES